MNVNWCYTRASRGITTMGRNRNRTKGISIYRQDQQTIYPMLDWIYEWIVEYYSFLNNWINEQMRFWMRLLTRGVVAILRVFLFVCHFHSLFTSSRAVEEMERKGWSWWCNDWYENTVINILGLLFPVRVHHTIYSSFECALQQLPQSKTSEFPRNTRMKGKIFRVFLNHKTYFCFLSLYGLVYVALYGIMK